MLLRSVPGFSVLRGARAAGLLVALLVLAPLASASPVGELEAEDTAVVESLALYDPALRRDALEAVTEADVLTQLVRRQERSSETFRQLLDPYDRQVQEDVYELARYPELVSEIVEGGPKSQADLEAIAFRYPKEAAEAAARSGADYWKVIARTDALLRDENSAFEATIGHLPDRKQDAFRSLLGAPDLLVLLAENTSVAVLLGDAYEREPDAVLAWLDNVSGEVAARSGDETRELAVALEEDEELASEVAAATDEYEHDTGYSAYPQAPTHQTHVSVNVSPFPFWIGHPWWYANTYSHYDPWYWWYPHFAWSFGGTHFGPRFHASFSIGIGWPHGAFWGWYFGGPSHHGRYGRVTHHVVGHFERHGGRHHRALRFRDSRRFHARHARPGRHAVHRFVRDTGRSMPRGFHARDGRRVERFREYGRLHGERGRDDKRGRVHRSYRDRQRGSDLIRRARADGKRFPRLSRLSREPERSRSVDRRERARRDDRGEARRDDRREARRDGRRDVRPEERRDTRRGERKRGNDVADRKQTRDERRVARRDDGSRERRSETRRERRSERGEAKGSDREKRRSRDEARSDDRRERKQAREKRNEDRRAKREREPQRREARVERSEKRERVRSETARRERRENKREREPRKASDSRKERRRSDVVARRDAPGAQPRVERPRREPRAERRSNRAGSDRAQREVRHRSSGDAKRRGGGGSRGERRGRR